VSSSPEKNLYAGKIIAAFSPSSLMGSIFLSGCFSGRSPLEVLLCASHDGQPIISLDNAHLYRAQWLWDNFPHMRISITNAIQLISNSNIKNPSPS
jgi:hypothetical protein